MPKSKKPTTMPQKMLQNQRKMLKECLDGLREMYLKVNETSKWDKNYENLSSKFKNCVQKLEFFDKSLDEPITKEEFEQSYTNCLTAMNELETEAKLQRGWHKVHPVLRAIAGVFTAISVLGIFAVSKKSSHGFMNTFFSTPQTRTWTALKDIKDNISNMTNEMDDIQNQQGKNSVKSDIVISEPEENESDKNTISAKPVEVKAKNSLEGIPRDKLFISQSGYAYNIDVIVSKFYDFGGPLIFVDYLNPDGKEYTVHFTSDDIKQLLDFPSVEEAFNQFCKDKGGSDAPELAELASLIPEEVLKAMYEVYTKGVSIPVKKRVNEDEYTKIMLPSMFALNEAVNKMNSGQKLSLKLFMDNMGSVNNFV